MTGADEKSKKRRRSRPRPRTASTHSLLSNGSFDQDHYVNLARERLENSKLIPKSDQHIQARQTRHVHNYQHAIPFRQEFTEKLAHDMRELDRQVRVHHRELEQKDKRDAYIIHKAERTFAKKERELELYNNRQLRKEILSAYINRPTAKDQLHLIRELQRECAQLRTDFNELNERVNRNANTCNEANRRHDEVIDELKQRSEEYRKEIEDYKKTIDKKLADLESKLQDLNKKYDEHGALINDLSIEHDTINNLSQNLLKLIKNKQSDLDQLENFAKRLDDIKQMIDQIRLGLQPLEKLPELERQLQDIQKMFIDMKNDTRLQNRVSELEQTVDSHAVRLEYLTENLNAFEQFMKKLNDQLSEFQRINQRFSAIEQRLQSLENDLQLKTTDIDDLRKSLNDITKKLSDLTELIEKMPPPTEFTENPFQERLENLERDLAALKNIVDNLSQQNFDEKLQKTKEEIIKQLTEMIQALQAQLDELANRKPEPPPSSTVETSKSIPIKLIPYVETLPPIDLLNDIWTTQDLV